MADQRYAPGVDPVLAVLEFDPERVQGRLGFVLVRGADLDPVRVSHVGYESRVRITYPAERSEPVLAVLGRLDRA